MVDMLLLTVRHHRFHKDPLQKFQPFRVPFTVWRKTQIFWLSKNISSSLQLITVNVHICSLMERSGDTDNPQMAKLPLDFSQGGHRRHFKAFLSSLGKFPVESGAAVYTV